MARLLDKPEKISKDHYLLKIETGVRESLPGQFINIRTSRFTDPLLRRPFSIFNHENKIIDIVIRTVGKGTEILANHDRGDIDVLGPIGKGFTTVKNSRVLIAGGGVGNAPLFYLAKILKKLKNEITFIYGARSGDFIYLPERFKKNSDRFIVTTDDGSVGKKGSTIDIAGEILGSEEFDMIYSCGPAVMMRKVVKLAKDKPIEVAVERFFGCGIGFCYGCTVDTMEGFKRVCIDGPVFDGKQ